jgi:hypothetical protein
MFKIKLGLQIHICNSRTPNLEGGLEQEAKILLILLAALESTQTV